MKRRASYRSGLAFGGLSSVALILLGLVSSILVARVYGVRVIGEFALATAPSLALTYLSTAQEQAALVRKVAVLPPRAPEVTGLFAAVMTFSFALTTVVALLTLGVTALLFHGPIDHPELIAPAAALVASQTLVTNTCWNLDMVLSAFRAGRELFWVRLGQAVVFVGLAVGLGLADKSVWGLVAAMAGSWAVALAHRLVAIRGFMRLRAGRAALRDGFRTLPEMVRFGIRLAPSGLASGVASQIGIWVLGALGSLGAVGAYQRAWQLGNRFLEVNTRVNEVLLPTLVERRHGKDAGGFDRALVDSMRYVAVAMFLPAAVGGGAGHGVMALFGPGFEQAGDTLAVLLAVPALAGLSGVQAQVLIAEGRPGRVTLMSIARALATAGLTFLLVPAWGMLGAAAAWALCSLVSVLAMQALVRPHLTEPLTASWTPRQLTALVLACGAGFGLARLLDTALGGPLGLIAALLAGSAAYAAVFTAGGGIAARDRERARELGAKLGARLRGRPGVPAEVAGR